MASSSAGAAEARRRLYEEEEEMTKYSAQDLGGEWEFKIVRSITGTFRNKAAFEKLVEEEAQAGWILLEKFDDSRVRFKRPVSQRQRDSMLPEGVDPYRTQYGMSPLTFTIILTGSILAGTVLFMLFIFVLVGIFTGAAIFGASGM